MAFDVAKHYNMQLCICLGRPNQAPHYPVGLKSTSRAEFDVSNLSGELMKNKIKTLAEILLLVTLVG